MMKTNGIPACGHICSGKWDDGMMNLTFDLNSSWYSPYVSVGFVCNKMKGDDFLLGSAEIMEALVSF